MIADGQEHVCTGCYEFIAPHDPEAYQAGDFYYHSKSHEDRHTSRISNALFKAKRQHEAIRESDAG